MSAHDMTCSVICVRAGAKYLEGKAEKSTDAFAAHGMEVNLDSEFRLDCQEDANAN